MSINIEIAEKLISAFDSEETGIILWDRNDNIEYRNQNISERFTKLNIDFEVGQNFFDRIKIYIMNVFSMPIDVDASNNITIINHSNMICVSINSQIRQINENNNTSI